MNYKKIILVISFLAVFSFLFGFNAPAAKAETVDELKAIIVALQQQVAQLQKQLDELLGKPKAWCHNFNRNLKYGNAGEEVRALQTALEKEGFYKTTINGDFDEYTASAVVGFQEKYAAEILAPWGLEHGTGHVGPTTRAKLNKLYGCGVVPQNPSITVLSPNGGEKWEIGKTYVISWSGNISTSKIVEIQLYRGTTYLKTITDNAPSGSANGSYSWTISNDIPIANDYKVKVSFWGGPSCPLGQVCAAVIYEYSDFSDAPFSVVTATTTPSITVLSPNGGEKWEIGKTYDITWKSQGVNRVYISLIWTGGGTEQEVLRIANGISASLGRYTWQILSNLTIENLTGQGWKIEIVDYDTPLGGGALWDSSDAPFSIVAAGTPSITVLSPNGGEKWVRNSVQKITWTYQPLPPDKFEINLVNAQSDSVVANLKYCSSDVFQDNAQPTKFWWNWSVGQTANGTEIPALGPYRIMVSNCGNVRDFSDSSFSMVNQQVPSITVLSPNGGEKWTVGNTYQIFWESTGIVQTDKIRVSVVDYTFSYPTEYDLVYNLAGNLGAYSWAIPTNFNTAFKYKIKVEGCKTTNGITNCYSDLSDNYFSIVAVTCIRETTKAGVTCGGYFYKDTCGNSSDGTGYAYKRKCNAPTGTNCSSLVNVDNIFCPYGCQNSTCLRQPTDSITVISPNGGEQISIPLTGTIKDIEVRWSFSGITDPVSHYYVLAYLKKGNTMLGRINSSGTPLSFGGYTWAFPKYFDVRSSGLPFVSASVGSDYKIKLELYRANTNPKMAEDESDNYFSIVD